MGCGCTKTDNNDVITKNLLTPIKLGPYNLSNRVVMAAMTRCRADPKTCVPSDLHVKYYSERALNTGMILTECSSVSPIGNSFPGAAGIWTDEQVLGWKSVVDAVHTNNSKIYLQIWHAGRASRESQIGVKPVAPSAVPIRSADEKNEKGYIELDMPEELTEEQILKIVEEFREGAKRAKKAGFDGLELHGANGYLIDQFLRDGTNKRNDKYGGSIENRVRFPLMVIDALISVYGADKVGIKISPVGRYGDMFDSNPVDLYRYFLELLSKKKISFVEVYRGPETLPYLNTGDPKPEEQMPDVIKSLMPSFKGLVVIGNNNFTYEEANEFISNGKVDMVSFAKPFVANPDLVKRWENGWKLNEINWTNIYYGGAEGYTDYAHYKN